MRRLPDSYSRKSSARGAGSLCCHDVRTLYRNHCYTRPIVWALHRYIGALPLALGVRSTNLYEDRSIALYDEDVDTDTDPSLHMSPSETKAQVWGSYIVCFESPNMSRKTET